MNPQTSGVEREDFSQVEPQNMTACDNMAAVWPLQIPRGRSQATYPKKLRANREMGLLYNTLVERRCFSQPIYQQFDLLPFCSLDVLKRFLQDAVENM